MNNHISVILEKVTDTIPKTDKQEEKTHRLSSKLSTYEDHMDKVTINKIQQPLPLQVNNYQDDKITFPSPNLSNF